jgi:hypothetical protein
MKRLSKELHKALFRLGVQERNHPFMFSLCERMKE